MALTAVRTNASVSPISSFCSFGLAVTLAGVGAGTSGGTFWNVSAWRCGFGSRIATAVTPTMTLSTTPTRISRRLARADRGLRIGP